MMIDFKSYQNCTLCPRNCGINRLAGETGVCGETAALRIASIGAHHGEEPPISGVNGSGTVFFSGCSLRCSFCQNYDISHFHVGETMSLERVVGRLQRLVEREGVHNINFVTPDHFLPHTVYIVRQLRERGVEAPVLYNTSGYMKTEAVRDLADFADIYMPDFKFADAALARRLAAADYPEIALAAIAEMVRQKGFLDADLNQRTPAQKGVFIRHLVMPGHVDNSIRALELLHETFGEDVPVNVMSQYWPAQKLDDENLNRRLYDEEYDKVVAYARELRFSNLLVQSLR